MLRHELLVHGTKLRLQTDMPQVATDFAHDFSYFLKSPLEAAGHEIFVVNHFSKKKCPWPPITSSSCRRSKHGRIRGNYVRLCMFGNAQVEYDFSKKYCHIYCSDIDISYEVIYLVTLSYLGESLDIRGCHRIHGFGFVTHDIGGILLAPSGGGKSTLAMELIRRNRGQILSDDTPVLTKDGNMLAFPQRIALRERPDVPEKYCRQFKRFQFGNKFVVGSDFFSSAITPKARIQWLLLKNKNNSEKASMQSMNRLHVIWPLMKWLVIGYETPQIWELFVRPSFTDVLSKIKILFSRIGTALRIFSNVKVAKFTFSDNPIESANVFDEFFNHQIKIELSQ